MGVTTRGSDGRLWTVRRRIGWPHFRRLGPQWLDEVPLASLDYGLAGGLIFALALAVLLGLTLILLPVIAFIVEAAVAVVGVSAVLRPWEVEAKTDGPVEQRVWRVRGWKGSKQAVEEVARELSLGVTAAPDETER